MTIRNLQTSTDYATLTAAIAALPNPLDQDYVLEDQDQATYTESQISLTIDTAAYRLTIQGRPGIRPTFNSPIGGGGKGATYSGVLSVSGAARRVTLRDVDISDGFVSFANIGGTNAHEVDRCLIRTTGADPINLNDLGAGPGGGVPAALVTNCVLLAASGQAAFCSGDEFVAFRHCTFSSFADAPPDGGSSAILWLPTGATPSLELRNCILRYSDSGLGNQGGVWTNTLGLSTLDSDGNLFNPRSGTSNIAWVETTATAISTLGAWQTASGGDANSVVSVSAFPDTTSYTDEAARDLSLLDGSPAVDAVLAIYGELLPVDIDNTGRPVGAASDLGAYESPTSAPVSPAGFPIDVSRMGGDSVQVTGLGLSDGEYYVDLGLDPAVSAVRAYSPTAGQASRAVVVGGVLEFVTPPLAKADDYRALITPVSGGSAIPTGALLNAVDPVYFSSTFGLRSSLPVGLWNVGPLDPTREPFS